MVISWSQNSFLRTPYFRCNLGCKMKHEHETWESDKEHVFGLGIICKLNLGKSFDYVCGDVFSFCWQRWVWWRGEDNRYTFISIVSVSILVDEIPKDSSSSMGLRQGDLLSHLFFHHYHGTTYISEWRKKES